MDVLITHSNHLWYDEKQRQKMQPYPPLQTLLAAAVLRQQGLRVEVCDVTLEAAETRISKAIARMAPCLVVVCEDDFNFLTKMCLLRNRELAFWTAKAAKACGCRVAIHGSDSSDHVSSYIAAGFDYVLIGEVEETLRQLATGMPPAGVDGLAFVEERSGRIRFTAPRHLRNCLDGLPMPAWDLIDIGPYRDTWLKHHGYFSMNLVSSRGCPYRCNWCAKPIYGNHYRVRSPQAVAEEMSFIKEHFAPDHLWFADDIFALSAQWTREFAAAVERQNAAIPFKMQSRCDLMTRSTVADLKRAGCVEIWMGAESGSQRVLDAMDKGIRVEQIYEARRNLSTYGIRACWFLQFGYPAEDWEDIESTIRMVRTTRPHDIGISVSYPLPGTKFHQLVSAELGKKANWSESGDLTMMFRGPFSTELYRAIAHALHLEVRSPSSSTAITQAWATVEAIRATERARVEVAS
ncbi:MAG TPA: radical SAM protein [Bryobacteraceae bacterium]|jgi:radical SAM superfamily enzyme YgiQ (UPF0313 family)